MITTAEEFWLDKYFSNCSGDISDKGKKLWLEHNELAQESLKIMIEFAKFHVEACKKELAELVDERLKDESQIRAFLIDGSSILNAYPLENIK